MTKREFEAEIAKLTNRAALLKAALRGEITLTPVVVRRALVRAHWRREHVRHVAPRRR